VRARGAVSDSERGDEFNARTVSALAPQEASQPVSEDHGAHDDQDDQLLRELTRLRAAGRDDERQREIMGELISGWEPYFRPWLVLRIGRHDGDEVASRVLLRLFGLLLRRQQFTAAWGAVVWRTVRDEAYRFYRECDGRREQPVAETHTDPDAEPYDDPIDQLELDPNEDARRLMALLAELSPRDRRIIELTVLEEQPRTEAAASLGIKLGALDTAKHRALERLAKLAARDGVSAASLENEKKA
jgi:RNA polymerase sigma factor (sigma-70 family)